MCIQIADNDNDAVSERSLSWILHDNLDDKQTIR